MSDSYSGGSHSDADMAAQDATPWIGVHVLTEFIFCPRAGLIAFEQQRIDPGEEIDGAPRLDYLPDFEIELIEAALQKTWSGIRGAAYVDVAGGAHHGYRRRSFRLADLADPHSTSGVGHEKARRRFAKRRRSSRDACGQPAKLRPASPTPIRRSRSGSTGGAC